MLQIFVDRWLALVRINRRQRPSWVRRSDPYLPRLRQSYRWWVRW